jgi:UDP-glucose 4-epimerase
MRVLITGGAGFLGSHLAEAFVERGAEVTVFDLTGDLKVRHLRGRPGFHRVYGSILDKDLLEGLVARADLVYHLAAVVGVEHYVGDPFQVMDVNVNGTQNALKACYKHAKKMVFCSTSEVYGRNPRVPWREEDDRVLGSTETDRWCYSTSKAAGEHFCFAYRKMGLPVTVLRYFNVYGPRLDMLDRGRVITIFLGQLLRGRPLTVIGDGAQTRCFTYVSDAVRATIEAGIRPEAEGRVLNIGSDVETSVVALARLLIEVAGTDTPIEFVKQEAVYGDSYEDIPRRVPDVTRMRELLGVTAAVPLREGLERTVRWFRDVLPTLS